MKKNKPSVIDAFMALPDDEKERQCREFDKEFIADTFKPLTADQRKLWERAKRRGRPVVGRGAKVISLSMEDELLKRTDKHAKAAGISRSALVARALRHLFAKSSRNSRAA